MGFVAVCVYGECENGVPTNKVRVCIAQDPEDIFKIADMHNCREIVVHGVLWTPGKIFAEDLKRAVVAELLPYNMKGTWYELGHEYIVNTVAVCAQKMKVEIFNDHERYRRYEDAIARDLKKRQLPSKAREAAVQIPVATKPRAMAEVLPFGPRRR